MARDRWGLNPLTRALPAWTQPLNPPPGGCVLLLSSWLAGPWDLCLGLQGRRCPGGCSRLFTTLLEFLSPPWDRLIGCPGWVHGRFPYETAEKERAPVLKRTMLALPGAGSFALQFLPCIGSVCWCGCRAGGKHDRPGLSFSVPSPATFALGSNLISAFQETEVQCQGCLVLPQPSPLLCWLSQGNGNSSGVWSFSWPGSFSPPGDARRWWARGRVGSSSGGASTWD